MEYVLTTEALTKRYKHFSALNGLSLHVPKGAIYGLVGQNGAGKTAAGWGRWWRLPPSTWT